MKNIAIITARSGSKGLPDKNIRPLAGIPLIAYTIKAALGSGMFDTVMVSTDSEEYARIAREYGAEVPFLRSEETSTDTAGSWDVVREVLKNYRQMGKQFDKICLLQPTSPLRSGEDIRNAFAFMEEKKATNLLGATELGVPIPLLFRLADSCKTTDALSCDPSNASQFYARRQNEAAVYRINGAIYIVDKQIEDRTYPWKEDNCYYFLMPPERSVDVDSLLDFVIAESILKHQEEMRELAERGQTE